MPELVPSLRTPEHWRRRAEEARSLAEQMDDPDAKASMLEIAAGYERLAGNATTVNKDDPR